MNADRDARVSAAIVAVLAGDRQAFATIVEAFEAPMFGFLTRLGLDPGVAEEVAQEAFVRAWRHLDAYRPQRARFSTWLFTIARNLAHDAHGRTEAAGERVGDDVLDAMPSDAPTALERLVRAQRDRRLEAAIRRLPAGERSVLALAYVDDLDLAAVARIEGISVGAVKTRLHRARERLRQWLEDDDG